jgi:hypothetical protein
MNEKYAIFYGLLMRGVSCGFFGFGCFPDFHNLGYTFLCRGIKKKSYINYIVVQYVATGEN